MWNLVLEEWKEQIHVPRIYSIKLRPQLNAADGSKITNKRLPRIKRRAQSEKYGVYSRIILHYSSWTQITKGAVTLKFP